MCEVAPCRSGGHLVTVFSDVGLWGPPPVWRTTAGSLVVGLFSQLLTVDIDNMLAGADGADRVRQQVFKLCSQNFQVYYQQHFLF